MKDFPQSQDEYNDRYMNTPNKDKDFYEWTECLECGGTVEQHFAGDEGWGICNDCSMIEGNTRTMYECSLCGESSETEECNCYLK
jgi:hypothetical protein